MKDDKLMDTIDHKWGLQLLINLAVIIFLNKLYKLLKKALQRKEDMVV